ncbi:MAG: transcription-repair coupling factor (mfd), partial [Acidobacteria bacterium]|nr:transcription-repair coupling factor (mfd) [Acidobacteriota bacterium]
MDAAARQVSGLTPSAKALFVAAAAHAQPSGVVLYIVPGDGDLEQTCADVSFFLAALEGFTAAAAERAVLPFPSHEVDPYRGLAPHIGVTSVRARALYAIAQGAARVVIASAAAVLPRVTTPDRMLAASLALKPGQDISPVDLAELLVDAGFTREDPADEHGEFAIRGGIADVFPAGEAHPVRLEFIGDTIETLRTYDPATQRSIAPIDQMAIIPLRDVLQDNRGATIFDYLSRASASRIIVSERDEVDAHATKILDQINQSYRDIVDNLSGPGARTHAAAQEFDEDGVPVAAPRQRTRPRASDAPAPDEIVVDSDTVASRLANATELSILGIDGGQREIRSQPAVELKGRVADWVAEIRRLRDDGESILFVAATPGRAERTIELLKEYEVFAIPVERAEDARYAAVLVAVGALSRGFRLPDAGLQIYAEPDVFEEERRAPERRRAATKAFLSDLRDLKVGDYVVHVDNGIGMFVGLKQIGVGDSMQEFLELRYAGEDKLFVPVERLDLVQKYTGASKPPIDRLGGASWEKAKSKVKKAMRDMAEELLKLYAARRAVPGHAFAADSHWQQEFEDAFEYDLTVDQKSAVADIKRDMESSTPMDRLLCGDVGYGKTEVAMRAAFKAAMDGKQVAFLAPTTVLAFQHQKTLKERFAGFPVRIDMVSRFRSKAEQAATLVDLAAGKVDLIVGTHRLLSKDVGFRDLGLLVVDEEQRFGVAHKEKIKQMKKKVDVLTMSATPIPRTLNMSLIGIRDMSIIETPPKDRLSIQTNVVKFD